MIHLIAMVTSTHVSHPSAPGPLPQPKIVREVPPPPQPSHTQVVTHSETNIRVVIGNNVSVHRYWPHRYHLLRIYVLPHDEIFYSDDYVDTETYGYPFPHPPNVIGVDIALARQAMAVGDWESAGYYLNDGYANLGFYPEFRHALDVESVELEEFENAKVIK